MHLPLNTENNKSAGAIFLEFGFWYVGRIGALDHDILSQAYVSGNSESSERPAELSPKCSQFPVYTTLVDTVILTFIVSSEKPRGTLNLESGKRQASNSSGPPDLRTMELDTDVLIIGAGLSGLGFAIQLQKTYGTRNFEIVEKADSVGGTWWVNQYPGCGCDVSMYELSTL